MTTLLWMSTLLCFLAAVQGHTYHLGACPTVDPMPDFEMSRFLGKWYVIQKTSTGSRCLTNNYTEDAVNGGYKLEQVSEHLILGLTSVDHQYHYTGSLTVPSSRIPAKMTVSFPLSVAGTATYTVFMTDYENYAGVFTCQKLAFAHRQSASILSRTSSLDKLYLDKVRNRLSAFGVDPYDLSIISHTECPTGNGFNISIDPNTFSPESIAGVVRTAGDKIGDGIEVAADGAKTLYNMYNNRSSNNNNNRQNTRDREELSDDQNNTDVEAEWLP